jgi:hypothetical protein
MRHNVSFATPMRFCFDTHDIAPDAAEGGPRLFRRTTRNRLHEVAEGNPNVVIGSRPTLIGFRSAC